MYLNYLSKMMIFLSLTFALSMKSFTSTWIFMELNLLSFIMWLYTINDFLSMIKYFLIQAFFSTLLMFFFLSTLIFMNPKFYTTIMFLIILSKLGTPPMYLWFINFCLLANLKSLFMAATIQKIIPYMMLFNLKFKLTTTWVFISSFITLFSIHRIMNIKLLIAFSSMFNMMWIFLALTNYTLMFIFLFLYMINLGLLLNLLQQSSKNFYLDNFMNKNNPFMILMFFILIMSMMGIPPLTGFFSKIMILESTFQNFFLNFFTIIIMFTNMFMIFAYFQIMFLMLTIQNNFNMLKYTLNFQYFWSMILVNIAPMLLLN